MSEHILFLTMWIGLVLIVFVASGVVAAVFSAVVMCGFPESNLAKWLDCAWFDSAEVTDEILNHNAGECISKKLKCEK